MRSEPEELKNEETKFELFEYSIYSSSVLGQVQEQGAIGRTKTLSFDANFVERLISEISVPIQLKKSEEFFSSSAYSVDLEGIFIPIVAVGEARCGKSTSLNIIIQHLVKPELLTPKESYFTVRKGKEPVTDGIHGCLIRYSDMKTDAQEMLNQIFGPENTQEKHVVLFDCEGTGVGDKAEINKLYTAGLLISLKGVFMASTSKRIYESFVDTFLINYETHKALLEPNQKPNINMSILVKDQSEEEKDLSNDEIKQDAKRRVSLGNLTNSDRFLTVVKPMICYLSETDRSERAAFDEGNYDEDASPLVCEVIKCFWNIIRHFQKVFTTSGISSASTLSNHLTQVIKVINGEFRNQIPKISSEIYISVTNFSTEVSHVLPSVQPGLQRVSDTLHKICSAFMNHKIELHKTLVKLGENLQRIQACMTVYDHCCQKNLKSIFVDYRMIRFMHYEYLSKMLNKHSIWQVSSKSIGSLKHYHRGLTEAEMKKLREECSLIAELEKADKETRKEIEYELSSFPIKPNTLPLEVLKEILNRRGSRGSGAQFEVLKFNVIKHVVYLYILVVTGYTIRPGRTSYSHFQIEVKRLRHLKATFKNEIRQKEFLGLHSDDERFAKHIQGLVQKTLKSYLHVLCG